MPSFRETAVAIYRDTPLAGLYLFQAGYHEDDRSSSLPPHSRAPFRQLFAEATQAPQPPANPCPAARASCRRPPERANC